MLKNAGDIRSLVFIFLNMILLYTAVSTTISWMSVILVVALVFVCYLSLNINHNLLHVPMFHSPALNVLLNSILSICTGIPVTVIYYPHIVNHHPNACNEKDWTGAHLVTGKSGLDRIFSYIFKANFSILKHRPKSFFEGLNSQRQVSLVVETVSLITFSVSVLYFYPERFFIHCLVPWILSQNALVFMNFLLHDGCEYNSETRHSRSFNSTSVNFFLLNGGYHMAHHLKPTMHWSELAAYHRDYIDPKEDDKDLTQSSLFKHVIQFYFKKK